VTDTSGTAATEYAAAGVDLARADAAKARIGQAVAGTRTALSLGEVGAFGGMVRVPAGLRKPVLVMSTDGVGTKVLVALQAGRYDTVGEDLVNHSANDILVHGAGFTRSRTASHAKTQSNAKTRRNDEDTLASLRSFASLRETSF
jgi:hypothetical protein